MKYIAQVIYPEFTELFDVNIEDNNLDIELKEVLSKPTDSKENLLTLDLSTDIRSNYSIFPNELGDLTVIQIHNQFVVSYYLANELHWFKFDSNELLSFLFQNDITQKIIPYLDEDKEILLNSLLCDLIRNDFSYSELNRKVKFLKISLILSFIHKNLDIDYSRIILDETVMGDIELDQIPMAFRYSQSNFLKISKINNLAKVLVLLQKNDLLEKEFKFIDNVFFINQPKNGEKLKLIFGASGVKFDYQVLPNKNYVFDLDEKEYVLNIGNLFKEEVRGKVFVFNGDEHDLMIS